MAVLVKVNEAAVTALGQCLVTVRPYKGADPQGGEDAYLWVSQTAGGEGLSMHGRIREVLGHGGGVDLRIDITDQAPRRPLTKEMLQPYRDGGAIPVMVGLAGKLYRHAHTKVAELDEAETAFLASHFLSDEGEA